jgi:glycosyltransferase involved in cell wall biosynthesis
VLEGGKYGTLFKTGDPDDLASRLQELLDHYDECLPVTKSAAEAVRRRYAIDGMCECLLQVY